MLTYDYYCKKCDKKHEDLRVKKIDDEVTCPDCENVMERLFPNKMEFDNRFVGSHANDYDKYGPR